MSSRLLTYQDRSHDPPPPPHSIITFTCPQLVDQQFAHETPHCSISTDTLRTGHQCSCTTIAFISKTKRTHPCIAVHTDKEKTHYEELHDCRSESDPPGFHSPVTKRNDSVQGVTHISCSRTSSWCSEVGSTCRVLMWSGGHKGDDATSAAIRK